MYSKIIPERWWFKMKNGVKVSGCLVVILMLLLGGVTSASAVLSQDNYPLQQLPATSERNQGLELSNEETGSLFYSSGKFNIGDAVEVCNTGSKGLLVRDAPNGNIIGGKFDGDVGVILKGPIYKAGYNWWQIRWCDEVLEGWSAEGYPGGVDYLKKKYVPPSTKFKIGDTVEVYNTGTLGLVVRTDPPELEYIGMVWDGDKGTVKAGPSYGSPKGKAGCYHFWKVDYGNAVGWCAENWLKIIPMYPPQVTTKEASSITTSSATLNGNLDSTGGLDCEVWFEYGTTTSYGYSTPKQSKSSTGSFSAGISGLDDDTTYHFRAVASNSKGTDYGSDKTFKTKKEIDTPEVTTKSASSVTTTSATLNGNLDDTGGETCQVWFEYGTTTPYGYSTPKQSKSSTGSFSKGISGLKDDTTYHFRAVASNSKGTDYGSDKTFKTGKEIDPPEVTTKSASSITTTSATLNGNLDDTGGETCQIWFEWGLTTSYGHSTTKQSKSSTGAFSAGVSGLNPETTYHFRAVAKNSKGTVYGYDKTFTTGTSITDQQKQQEILNMVNNHRGSLPTELVLAIIRIEGGEGAFHVDGWNYNSFYKERDGPWAQPTNGDGIMQVTTASGYHEKSGPYTHDRDGYDHAINDGCDYLLEHYATYDSFVQVTLHYNTGPNSLYIYLGKDWGNRDYMSDVAGYLSSFVPNMYGLQNQNLVNVLNQGQNILNDYLYNKGIATGQSVDYYRPYQAQLDNDLHSLLSPTVAIKTDKGEYSLGDTMNITLTFKNPSASNIDTYFIWYFGLPDYSYWTPVMTTPLTLPAGFDQLQYFSLAICDWGDYSFNARWYVALLETTPPYEIISEDTADWKYVSGKMAGGETIPAEIAEEIRGVVEEVELCQIMKKH
jgi:hypothetical protein